MRSRRVGSLVTGVTNRQNSEDPEQLRKSVKGASTQQAASAVAEPLRKSCKDAFLSDDAPLFRTRRSVSFDDQSLATEASVRLDKGVGAAPARPSSRSMTSAYDKDSETVISPKLSLPRRRVSLTPALPMSLRRQRTFGATLVKAKLASNAYKDPTVRVVAQQISSSSSMAQVSKEGCRKFVIDPRTSGWIGYWDLTTTVALVFTAIVTPVEVGFMHLPDFSDRWTDQLFLTNRLVDLIFICDIGAQFLLMYNAEGVNGGGLWVDRPQDIARHYVCSLWFALDVFSISVSGFDIFSPSESGAARFKALRAVRVLRLLKLVRLFRSTRIFKRWEMRVSINYALLSITNICVMLAFVCHLFACVWGLQASFDPLNTWLGTSQYCVPWSSTTNATHCHESLEHVRKDPSTAAVLCGECPSDMKCDVSEGWACVSPNRQYLYALYWSIATVTGIGYGDVVATPLHGVEQFVCVTMMLTGSLLFAYLVGSFCGLAATLSPDVVSFRQDLTDINKFMTENHIPPALRYQLREYMHQTVHLRRANTGNRLISNLAPKLRNEVALTINQRWLNVVDLLRDCEDGLKLELAYSITLQVFPPGESCPIGELYIVQRGAALFAGRAYLPGSTWGEAESLLTEPELRFPIPAVAIAYLFTYSISGDNLRATMSQEDKYPYAAEKLRRRQVTWIVRRGMVRKAEQEMCSRNERFRGRSSLYYCARNTLYQRMSSAGNQRYPGMKLANAIATNAGEMTNPTPGRACKRRATLGLHSSMDLGTPGAAAGGDSGSMAQQQSTLQRTDSCSRHGSFISETLPQINSSLVVETRFRAMQEEISTLKSSVGELRSSLDRGLGEILRRLGQGDDDGLPGAKMGSGEGDGGGVASRIGLHNLLTA